jgi:glutamate receptor, ionotropic, plant
LTSILTVQQLRPTVTDIHDLIRNGNCVGYGRGSFVEGLLQQLGFDEKRVKAYNVDEFGDALNNRSVAVVVDEVPYIKSFLAKHCNSYMMIPISSSAGFGFVSWFLL